MTIAPLGRHPARAARARLATVLGTLLCFASAGLPLGPARAAVHRSKPSGGLDGIWSMDMTGYKPSTLFTERQRVARSVQGEAPPLQPWAAALLEKRVRDAEDGKIFANNAAKCLPQGLPYMIFAAVDGPIQIIESAGQITILSTELAEHWLIYMNAKHPADFAPNYHGDSIGHWEGDTLVVDTIGLSGDKTTVDQVGTPHSDELRMTTRFRKINPNDLEIRVTLDDPKAFTKPWDRRVLYKRSPPGTRIDEWVCENLHNAPDENGFQTFRH